MDYASIWKPVSGWLWSFSTRQEPSIKSCSGWKFGAFWLGHVTRKIIGRFTKKEVTIVTIEVTDSTNGRVVNCAPEVAFSLFRALLRFQRFIDFALSFLSLLLLHCWEWSLARVLEGDILVINWRGDCTNKSARKLRN